MKIVLKTLETSGNTALGSSKMFVRLEVKAGVGSSPALGGSLFFCLFAILSKILLKFKN